MIVYANPADFAQAIQGLLASPDLRVAIHEAAASAVHTIVLQNIGNSGIDRPRSWPALSSRYARRVNRSHATLELTGLLKESVHSSSNADEGAVWFDDGACEYGPYHQWGEGHNPWRPFFPIEAGPNSDVTPYTLNAISEAAQSALESSLISPYNRD